MKGLRSIVALPRESLRGLEPAKIDVGDAFSIEWVDPRSLFVEESYQRDVGSKGVKLIRNIYARFSWARYKLPVCVRMAEWDDALVCIDGQHTAIAAASHPQLPKIPVMIVDAATAADRAGAFVGHNRDRVALTPVVIFHAELAAGDVLGQQVAEACRRSGAKVLDKMINLREKTPVGHTIAVGSLKNLARRRGVDALTRILRVLVAAERGPIKAAEIMAVDAILAGAGRVPAIDGRLQVVIASKSAEAWAAIGATSSAETGDPLGSAIATAWCRELDLRLSDGPGRPVLLRRKPPIDQKPGSDLVAKAPEPGSSLVLPPRRDAPFRRPPPDPQKDIPRHAQAAYVDAPEPHRHVEPEAPPPKPAPKPDVPAAPAQAPPPDSREVVARNGVRLELRSRTLSHRGRAILIPGLEEARIVAALLRVMPALLDHDRLASKAFPKENARDGRQRVKFLIDDVNVVLRAAKLEIRTMKVGSMLADLG